jgi:hypothetical protein
VDVTVDLPGAGSGVAAGLEYAKATFRNGWLPFKAAIGEATLAAALDEAQAVPQAVQVSWSDRFEDTVTLPGGRTLQTLREAATISPRCRKPSRPRPAAACASQHAACDQCGEAGAENRAQQAPNGVSDRQ